MDGNKQIQRFIEGVGKNHIFRKLLTILQYRIGLKRCIGFRTVHSDRNVPLVIHIFRRGTVMESKETKARGLEVITVQDRVNQGLAELAGLQQDIEDIKTKFITLEF